MKAIADGFKIRQIRAIATSAVREAANGRQFIREVSRQHKVRIDVISGEEEAQLAFHTAARHFDFQGRSTAVVDIGGGSVEVILSAGTAIDHVYSLPLGAVRVTERLVRSDPLKPKHWKEMKEEIDRGIRSVLRQPHHRAEIMIGSGGTFTALAHMSKFQREGRHGAVQGYVLTPSDIVHLLRHLRDTYTAALKTAIREAFGALEVRQRNLLRQHLLDELTIDDLARMYRAHRSTCARWLADARVELTSRTRKLLIGALGLRTAELDSLLRFLDSDIELSISRILDTR